MVELQLPKLLTWVRFPSPAPSHRAPAPGLTESLRGEAPSGSATASVPRSFHWLQHRNIGFGRQGASQQEIEDGAHRAPARFHHEPAGRIRHQGRERSVKLSGGERQRVSVARTALKRRRIYVFDEATSSLDSKPEKQILQNLIEVSRATTTTVVAHRLSTVLHAEDHRARRPTWMSRARGERRKTPSGAA
jgi:ABC-type Fe3+/spermidine/putrescine transport system ATPase subunit